MAPLHVERMRYFSKLLTLAPSRRPSLCALTVVCSTLTVAFRSFFCLVLQTDSWKWIDGELSKDNVSLYRVEPYMSTASHIASSDTSRTQATTLSESVFTGSSAL